MQKYWKIVAMGMFSLLEKITNTYITIIERPRKSGEVTLLPGKFHIYPPNTAIILQGPIVYENDFTLETIQLYKKTQPELLIIISTWSDEPQDKLEKIRNTGAEVVISNPPSNRGPRNINLQIISTKAGIDRAQKLGALYIAKSRTDQRLYAPQFSLMLHALLATFPYKTPFPKQKERIVICSHETLKYRLYAATDQFMFGTLHDLSNYWNAPLDSRIPGHESAAKTIREATLQKTCESYLEQHYFEYVGRKTPLSLRNSLEIFVDHFIIVDKNSLDLYWPKYGSHTEERFRTYMRQTTELISFKDWLTWYKYGIPIMDERIIDLPVRGNVPKNIV